MLYVSGQADPNLDFDILFCSNCYKVKCFNHNAAQEMCSEFQTKIFTKVRKLAVFRFLPQQSGISCVMEPWNHGTMQLGTFLAEHGQEILGFKVI